MPALSDITPLAWVLLGLAAVFVGVSKTALPGINTISIAIVAALMPAKASTGLMLLLLIVGDVFALANYARHANLPALVRLIPAVLVGLAGGALFLALMDDAVVRRIIGVILLVLMALTLWTRRRDAATSAPPAGSTRAMLARGGYGALGGFTTMVANAGGPVMSMYFLASRFPMKEFLGTAAWFFAVINITKVPISVGIGILTVDTALLALLLVPGVVLGAVIGRVMIHHISQQVFEWAVVGCTIAGALYLVFG